MRYKYVQKKSTDSLPGTLLVWKPNTDEHWIYTNDPEKINKAGNKICFTSDEWNQLNEPYFQFNLNNSHFVEVDE
ncbi:hypothetical protein HC026_11015 [Lactobacillus sp. LC28-10]|uniref:Uncharacterized protein n=1 Tax=Secundilactobacillus angelensis TaxID=2722706 RepID=A0ABX1KZT1_9LACO|nr:hypothetical protein [Secundilactobacillus angelensis]MCH5463218.1 hypothetical protein [Secundilactobacillus angelensis]NLR19423.1 hypothetical protein [Secundilactobacillus angelensis]